MKANVPVQALEWLSIHLKLLTVWSCNCSQFLHILISDSSWSKLLQLNLFNNLTLIIIIILFLWSRFIVHWSALVPFAIICTWTFCQVFFEKNNWVWFTFWHFCTWTFCLVSFKKQTPEKPKPTLFFSLLCCSFAYNTSTCEQLKLCCTSPLHILVY